MYIDSLAMHATEGDPVKKKAIPTFRTDFDKYKSIRAIRNPALKVKDTR
jgi:hypothetical protein